MNTTKSNHQALILTASLFEDMEVFYPYYRLQEEGWDVVVASPTLEIIQGKHGYKLKPDVRIDQVDPNDFQLLILPGGSKDGAPGIVREIQEAQEIARSFMEKNKLVAAICHGPYTLISADVLKGRHLTSIWTDGVPDEIQQAGAIWEDKEVVVDKNLISSRSPKDLPAFMREIVKALA